MAEAVSQLGSTQRWSRSWHRKYGAVAKPLLHRVAHQEHLARYAVGERDLHAYL